MIRREEAKIARLAQARRAKGLTQAELAAKSGVHRVTIARLERGKGSPNAKTLKRLAAALGVSLDALVEEKAG